MQHAIDTKQTAHMAKLFRVIGDSTRLKIMQLLLSQEGLCVGEVAEKLDISTPATSQHLKLLELHGLLEPVRYGQRICYQPNKSNEDTLRLINTIQSFQQGENL